MTSSRRSFDISGASFARQSDCGRIALVPTDDGGLGRQLADAGDDAGMLSPRSTSNSKWTLVLTRTAGSPLVYILHVPVLHGSGHSVLDGVVVMCEVIGDEHETLVY